MKKFMVILLTLSLITGISVVTFAEGNSATLTPELQQAKDAYLKGHPEEANQLATLKKQTENAKNANNAATKQIQQKLKAKITLKDVTTQRKALVTQAKQLHEQMINLKAKYKAAVKTKDADKMKSIKLQMLDLNKQISDIKVQIAPLKEGMKGIKDANKQLKDNVKNQLQQAKTIKEAIKTQEKEKTQLLNTYKENIKNKDYVAAGKAFKAIIDKESATLNNITQIGTILNQVLASLN